MAVLTAIGDGVEIAIKVVPGASRTRLVGILGDALKIQVSAPPERGKANQAVEQVLADALGIPPKSVTVVAGLTSPRKTVRALGITIEQARAVLELD